MVAWMITDPPKHRIDCFDFPSSTSTGSVSGGGVLDAMKEPVEETVVLTAAPTEIGQIYGSCKWNEAYKITLNALVLATLCLAVWMSWKTRKIREDVSDSRRIFQVLCFHFVIFVVSFVESINWNFYTSRFFTPIVLEFLFAVSVVVFLISPKIYFILYKQRHGKLPDGISTRSGTVTVTGVSLSSNVTASSLNCTGVFRQGNSLPTVGTEPRPSNDGTTTLPALPEV